VEVDKEYQKDASCSKERYSTARVRWFQQKVIEAASAKDKTALLALFRNVVELVEASQIQRSITGVAMLELAVSTVAISTV
jgi:hypothetical protein